MNARMSEGARWYLLGIAIILLILFVALGVVFVKMSRGQDLPAGCHPVDPFDCSAAPAEGMAPLWVDATVTVGGQDSAEIDWNDGAKTAVAKSGVYGHLFQWMGTYRIKFTAKNAWDKKEKICCVITVKDKPVVSLDCWSDSDGGAEPFIAKITVRITGQTEADLYFMRDGKTEKTISNVISGDYYETLDAGKWTVKLWGRNAYGEKEKTCCTFDIKKKQIDCTWLPRIFYAGKNRAYLPLRYELTPRMKDGKLAGYLLDIWGRGTRRNPEIKIETYYQFQKIFGPDLKDYQEYLTIETWPLPDRNGSDGRFIGPDQFEAWLVRDFPVPLGTLLNLLFKVRCQNCGEDFVFTISTLNPLRGIAYFFPQAVALK
jgi:hypothetical protein